MMSKNPLDKRRIWHVNTVSRGGGVAEILEAMEEYSPAGSPEFRRFIMTPDPRIFSLTKTIHHRLHGNYGGELPSQAEHERFVSWGRHNAERLLQAARTTDPVILHDPQTLPMIPVLAEAGLQVAWRCHIGTSEPNEVSESTWDYITHFLSPGVPLIFSDKGMVPSHATDHPVFTIPPSIDPRSEKNREIDDDTVDRCLAAAGLPVDSVPIVLQISRWDPLKDMCGVLDAFTASTLPFLSRLVLCGPSPESVADDPEASDVFSRILERYRSLPPDISERVHLICTTTQRPTENNLLVNALQRRAAVVVQKSLQEGFGLTVTEAMWKARPVVASKRGGLVAQVIHGRTGLLLEDPYDLNTFTNYVARLLHHPQDARALGDAARRHVEENFLTPREVLDHTRVYELLAGRISRPRRAATPPAGDAVA
ncbi:MAG: glycosyltransferase [Actinomycetota bacterium]|nr:glycosyltransferase [Actinomycetota bacterium]